MGYPLRAQRFEIEGQVLFNEGRQPLVQPGVDLLVPRGQPLPAQVTGIENERRGVRALMPCVPVQAKSISRVAKNLGENGSYILFFDYNDKHLNLTVK